jgi:hypothetical protein
VRNRIRLGGLLLGVAAVAALAPGCTSSSGTPTNDANGQTGLAAYTACLAKNGVTLPSALADRTPGASRSAFPRASGRPSTRPSGGTGTGFGGAGGGFAGFGNQPPAGVDQATWDKAQQACASVRPTFSAGGNGGANNSALVAYRNCLSEHGVTITGGPGGAGLSTADPKTAAALAACAPLRPTAQPRPSQTPAG